MRMGGRFKLYIEGLVILLLIGSVILTGCGNGGETSNRETQPPEVYISHDPVLPQNGDTIKFIAAADDESGVDTIAIFVNGENVKQCQGDGTSTHLQCTQVLGPYYQEQTVEYWAFAVDCEGNSTKSLVNIIKIGL